MHAATKLTQKKLPEFLLHVAIVRPVFIWGPPGIGKTALVGEFARQVGMPIQSLLGSQLAPEDLVGVPQIVGGKSRFCPPEQIARDEAYVLFLDDLNASSHEVQKAFYSLIHEQRLGEYHLPVGSVVIGAGNRTQDSAIVKQMSSAVINRMIHVHLEVSHRDWLEWAHANAIHSLVLDYIAFRPDHLHQQPPKHEAPFSSPRSWHMLSDALGSYGDALNLDVVKALAHGTVSTDHATKFVAFYKQRERQYELAAILKGDAPWPRDPEDADILYFLADSFRGQLIKELPAERGELSPQVKQLVHESKRLLGELAGINLEVAQTVVAEDDLGRGLPDWFLVEVARDLPRLARRRAPAKA